MNNLSKLNDVLFDQLIRLTDDTVGDDYLSTEIERSKAVSAICRDIILNSKLAFDISYEPFKPDWVNYRQGAEDAKREPLKIMLVLKLMNKYKDSRIDLIRAVEKKHGIGVDDEN